MDIFLYNNKDSKNTINKNLTNELKTTGELKDETSIKTPSIRVNRNNEILNKNYMYIPIFKRKYFITDVIVDGKFFIVSCQVDVLESFKDEIFSSNSGIQVITRNENIFNNYLKDDMIQSYGKTFQVIKKIGKSPFNTEFLDDRGYNFVDDRRYNFAITVTNDFNLIGDE